MLIAIDGFEASQQNRVGVGRFEVELIKALSLVSSNNTFRIYTPLQPDKEMPKETQYWQYRIPSWNRLWSQITLPFHLYLDFPKPDVFFSPIHYAPRFCPIPVVLGIMDLSFLTFPEMFNTTDLYKLKSWTAYSVKKAKEIITISNSSKNDIIKQYQINPKRVHVIYPGFSPMTNTKLSSMTYELIKKKIGVTKNYILYVGTLQPRKNITGLIEAYKKILESDKLRNKSYQLVIVGKKGWMYDEIFEKVKREGLSNNVVFTGYVSDEELTELYKHAECFCLVSLYEGFGFPVLEAMSMGVPVIASNISSLPEIIGDTGFLVNPRDTNEIANAILSVLTMKKEKKDQLIKKAMERAKTFTWEKAARETLKILEFAVKN